MDFPGKWRGGKCDVGQSVLGVNEMNNGFGAFIQLFIHRKVSKQINNILN